MRISYFVIAFIAFAIGYVFTNTWISWLFGIPLITLSVFFVVLGFVLPGEYD
jgi:ABC-type uncharacterized transport system fused permease/ATPase subunit